MEEIRSIIRNIPNFPKSGIMFRDITPILASHAAFSAAIEELIKPFTGIGIVKVVGMESRGFIFGAPAALKLGAGFVPVRKPGKLPARTRQITYSLEYGTDRLEIHEDAIASGEKVLIVDDLLATGGTAAATIELVRELGGVVVGAAFVIELVGLAGASRLEVPMIHSLVRYE